MGVFLILYFLIQIILYINCQSYICRNSDSGELEIGDTAYLCIHIIGKSTRIAIPLEVDEYNVATIKGLYQQVSSDNNNIELLAQVGGTTSVFKSVNHNI
jgi:hypothetical protein